MISHSSRTYDAAVAGFLVRFPFFLFLLRIVCSAMQSHLLSLSLDGRRGSTSSR